MNKLLWQRRKLLLYLGLGITGLSATKVVGLTSKMHNSDNSISTSKEIVAIASNGQPLPEFVGISQWLNSKPLTTADLKGKVILVQFWTFACINCQRTLPYIVQWHKKYASRGLKVIGVHTPEFAYEREINNIKRALAKHQITYPVPIDNQFKTWQAYSNEYWPHLFLADRQGILRYDHIGEGAYNTTEQTIDKLLG